MNTMTHSAALSLLLFVLSLCFSTQPVIAQSSGPCIRTVASDVSLHQISGAFNGVFTEAGPALHGEPLHVELLILDYETPDVVAFHTAMGTKVDYLFRGKITADKKKSNFTAIVELIDVPRNIIVKSQTTSWSTSHDLSTEIKAGKELGQGFMPLKELLYEYEKIPLKGEINVPGDEVGTGDKVMINVEKLRFKEELPKSWQYLAVKVEKGKILNGTLLDGYYYFQIGKRDFIEIEYQAPEGCKDQTERMEVYNTCIFYWEGDNRSFSSLQKDKILSKEFPIVCYDGELVSESDLSVPGQNLSSHITSRIPFRRVGDNEVKGSGFAPGTIGVFHPSVQQAMGQFNNRIQFEGTITKEKPGKQTLNYNYVITEVAGVQTIRIKDVDGTCYDRSRISYEDHTTEHNIYLYSGDGSWAVMQYKSDDRNSMFDEFCFGCDNKGHCCLYEATSKKFGPMIKITVCGYCDGKGECYDFNQSTMVPPQSAPVLGKIEWRNGAESPFEGESNGAVVKGVTKLILYKKEK